VAKQDTAGMIGYATDTINPLEGCMGPRDDNGNHKRCKFCYAYAVAQRMDCELCRKFIPHVHADRYSQFQNGSNNVIFLSMSDWCDEMYKEEWDRLFGKIKEAKQNTFLLLTKQIENLSDGSCFDYWSDVVRKYKPIDNLYIGVTVNRKRDLYRIGGLNISIPDGFCAGRWVSFEPLFEDLGLGESDLKGLSQVVIGPQSKPDVIPNVEWVDGIVEQAKWDGVNWWYKNRLNFEGKEDRGELVWWKNWPNDRNDKQGVLL